MSKVVSVGETRVRLATEADLATINSIYNYYVLNSTCTFQTEPDTAEERTKWFTAHDSLHPITVATKESEVVAWASLSPYHHRCAYQHTVEDSVYVRNDMRHRGIGTVLLTDLIKRAEAHGHHSIIGIIAADQTDSIRLHQRFGFLKVGHIREAGHKFDRWLDVIFMQKMLWNLQGADPLPTDEKSRIQETKELLQNTCETLRERPPCAQRRRQNQGLDKQSAHWCEATGFCSHARKASRVKEASGLFLSGPRMVRATSLTSSPYFTRS